MTSTQMFAELLSHELVGVDLSIKFSEGLEQIIQSNKIVGNKLEWSDFNCKYYKGNIVVSVREKEYGLIKLI